MSHSPILAPVHPSDAPSTFSTATLAMNGVKHQVGQISHVEGVESGECGLGQMPYLADPILPLSPITGKLHWF